MREKAAGAKRVLVYGATVVFALLGPAVFWHGGVLEREATTFITHYTADGPLLNKIFDPRANDLGYYQARELSYLVDYLDAQFYRVILRNFNAPFFIPMSALVASLALVVVFMRGVRRTTKNVGLVAGALLLGCFLSSFMFISTLGVFYRSSKSLVAVTLLALLFHVRHVQQKRNRREGAAGLLTRDAFIAFCLALFAGLLDREGVFYTLTGCLILYVHYRWTGQLGDVLAAFAVAAGVLQFYNFVLAPVAIHTLNGYWPDFSYQTLPRGQAALAPLNLPFALVMLLENALLLLGGLPGVAILIVAVLATALVRATVQATDRRMSYLMGFLTYEPDRRTVIYGVLAFAPQVLMFSLMIARHPYVYFWLDHRYWYYAMPYVVTVLFGLLLALNAAMGKLPRSRHWVASLVLLMIVFSNVAGLNHHRRIMRESPWFGPVYLQSEALRSSLKSGVPDPSLDSYYRPFFEYHRQMRTGERR